MKEVVVIGAGIVGCFIAHACSKYEMHVTVIERRNDVCEEVSAANSAIVHAGYDPIDGTLKAKLNKRGADLYPEICKQLGVDYVRCGAIVAACGEEEEHTLEELYQRAIKRGVRVSYLDAKQVAKREPNIAQHVTKAMDVPDTAIVTPWELCAALMDEVLLNGGDLRLGETVQRIDVASDACCVVTEKGAYSADMVINAAGLGAQHIMEMVEETALFTITPKRGQYFVLSKHAKDYVKGVVYPVPSAIGKGVLAIPTVHDNILLGPNSEIIQDEDTSTTSSGLANVKKHLQKTMKNVPYQEVIHVYSGIRPSGNHGDFFIQSSTASKRIVHCACLDSPGLASAPAIAEYVMQEFLCNVLHPQERTKYRHRNMKIRVKDLDWDAKQACIRNTPAFGHIICRCEEISEQEVVDAIHRPCGARSIKGVKKRVRPGTGKCQGGFCEVEVARILARELHIPLKRVRYDADSYFMENKGVAK